MVPGNSSVSSGFGVRILQADPSYVKRCSCVFFLQVKGEKTWQTWKIDTKSATYTNVARNHSIFLYDTK